MANVGLYLAVSYVYE